MPQRILRRLALAPPLVLALPVPALAEIPAPVAAMIREAARAGDKSALDAVARIAKATHPDDADAIDALAKSSWTVAEAEAKRKQDQKLAAQGFFDGWQGTGQFGFGLTSGNTSETSAALGITLRKDGLHSRQKLGGVVDYLRSGGVTSREKFSADYSLNYLLRDGLYAYGALGWEQDRFAGYARRFSESLGVGARLINETAMTLDLDAGPAFRQILYTDDVLLPGEPRAENEFGGRANLSFDWRFANGASLTQNATALSTGSNTTLSATTALTSKLTGRPSAQLSFDVQHETSPPDDLKPTDTATRASLIVDF